MDNLTSKDKQGRILVDGVFKVCNTNTPERCTGSSCPESCIINRMIERLCDLEHKKKNPKNMKN